MILTLRINDEELKMIDEILSSEFCESENRSEWLRLLIHREWNKRKRLGVPKSVDFATSFRSFGGHIYGQPFKSRMSGGVIHRRRRDKISPLPVRAAGGDKSTARKTKTVK
ncbi:MAG TPA: hypothetical protein VHG71_06620 [Verrucomicrobiae bacterium]|nr:hypothetical protein [Verrucomicrobiae bacterium]